MKKLSKRTDNVTGVVSAYGSKCSCGCICACICYHTTLSKSNIKSTSKGGLKTTNADYHKNN